MLVRTDKLLNLRQVHNQSKVDKLKLDNHAFVKCIPIQVELLNRVIVAVYLR